MLDIKSLNAAGMLFIGLEIHLQNPEWDAMLSGGRLNFWDDGLRDALDPKLKR